MVEHVELVFVGGFWVEDGIEGGFGVVFEGFVGLGDPLVLSFDFSPDFVDDFSAGDGRWRSSGVWLLEGHYGL